MFYNFTPAVRLLQELEFSAAGLPATLETETSAAVLERKTLDEEVCAETQQASSDSETPSCTFDSKAGVMLDATLTSWNFVKVAYCFDHEPGCGVPMCFFRRMVMMQALSAFVNPRPGRK